MNEHNPGMEDDNVTDLGEPSFWTKTKNLLWEVLVLSVIYVIFTFDSVKGIFAMIIPQIAETDGFINTLFAKITLALIFSVIFIVSRALLSGVRYEMN
jgi:hypothetical protein